MNEKLETFRRLFPGRVEKLIKALRVVEHCSKSHCEFDPELVTKCWTQIALCFMEVAASFGVELHVTINGTPAEELQ